MISHPTRYTCFSALAFGVLGVFMATSGRLGGQEVDGRSTVEVYSGPQVGESLPALNIEKVVDGEPNTPMDASAQDAKHPHHLIIFLHKMTRPSVAFTRMLGDYAATRESDGLSTVVVFLGNDATQLAESIHRARHALPQNVTIAISPDGEEGPGNFGLNRNMTLTILVATKETIVANHAIVDPSLPVDLPKVLESLCAVVGGKPPTVESLLQSQPGGRPMRGREAGADKPNQPDRVRAREAAPPRD